MRPVLVLAGLLTSANAFALSCLWGAHTANVQFEDRVPTNAVLFVEHTFEVDNELEMAVLTSEGERVPVTVEMAHNSVYVRPEALEPGDYVLRDLSELGYMDWEFTVEDRIDDERPHAPRILEARRKHAASEWGDTSGVYVEIEPVDGATHYEYELSPSPDFADAWRHATSRNGVTLGTELCGAPFPGYDRSERYYVRVRSIDIAGNASEWTETDHPAGCSTVGAAPLVWGVPVGLLALGLRRRSR